jgi:hypothetical protein
MKKINRQRRRVLAGTLAAGLGTAAARGADAPANDAATVRRRFASKVALVTGATSGMGAVTSKALAREGAQVIFCGRREAEGRAVEAQVQSEGGAARFVKTDVTQEAQVASLLGLIERDYTLLDYAFNNVGTSDGTGLLHEVRSEDFDLVMNTYLRGNFLQLKYEIPLMLKNGGGAIVGNSSIAGMRYLANKAHYSGAKHGLVGMYCAAALGYAKKNLRINLVCPGLIKTEKAMRVLGGDEHALDARIPMGHIGESRDVADTVPWLFSDEARYITGAVIPIDGGQSVA